MHHVRNLKSCDDQQFSFGRSCKNAELLFQDVEKPPYLVTIFCEIPKRNLKSASDYIANGRLQYFYHNEFELGLQ